MAETETAVATKAPASMLVESKLYVTNAENNYMAFLEGQMSDKTTVELTLDEAFPRTEEEGEDTRIFLSFTNLNGNGTTFKITDPERLARRFDIDKFISGYYASVNEGVREEASLEIFPQTLTAAINMAVMNTLDLNPERVDPKIKVFSQNVLSALIAVLLNDPKDAVILLQERELRENQTENDVAIVGMWTVHDRDPN